MKQKFNFKPLPMLVAALTVADHFEEEKEVFIAEQPSWNDPFIIDFRQSVSSVMNEYFGVNTREGLQKQTVLVNQLAGKAKTDLDMLKTQIERGFRTVPGKSQEILSKLGFGAYWGKASNNNQTMLISLLLSLRNNLTAELRTGLEQNGVNPARIRNLLSYAETLNQANITQESLKGSTGSKPKKRYWP